MTKSSGNKFFLPLVIILPLFFVLRFRIYFIAVRMNVFEVTVLVVVFILLAGNTFFTSQLCPYFHL